MEAKAFCGATSNVSGLHAIELSTDPQSKCLCKVKEAIVRKHLLGAEARDNYLCFCYS